MSLLKRLLGKDEPAKRTRICVECGMPVEDHKDWCSILRGRQAMQRAGLQPLAPAEPEG